MIAGKCDRGAFNKKNCLGCCGGEREKDVGGRKEEFGQHGGEEESSPSFNRPSVRGGEGISPQVFQPRGGQGASHLRSGSDIDQWGLVFMKKGGG